MPDHATSTSPAVQAQLDRLFAHGPGVDVLGLDRITRLLARLGDPHRSLPPVLHVAGTNGKGSTCAFLRAAIEAAGYDVHVYSSPHLVRFNERVRLAGRLIDDEALAGLLAEVLNAGDGIGASFFEVTTAAAFLAFARSPAAACIVEVGLGGRLDATNVISSPAVCGIAGLGIDHQAFLGDTLAAIAAEKAGIAKPGVPLVTMGYGPAIDEVVAHVAADRGALLYPAGKRWRHDADPRRRHVVVGDESGSVVLPWPSLPGDHQVANLALAIAMLRRQQALDMPPAALGTGARAATWPARMQQLGHGPLTARLAGRAVWIDGAHNASAATEIAKTLPTGITQLVIGMLANKDAAAVLGALVGAGIDTVVATPVPGHAHHAPAELIAIGRDCGASRVEAAASLPDALARLEGGDGDILIAGSLYLAGEALQLNGELPT